MTNRSNLLFIEESATSNLRIKIFDVASIPLVIGTISLIVDMISELVVRSRSRIEYLINKKMKPGCNSL